MSENLGFPTPGARDPITELPTAEGPSIQPRHIISERYEIISKLGSGGMGEVWRAYDLKLRVDVALKSLRADLKKHEERTEVLRREVRTAREVISPNVCRIFDLVVEENQELISMEYVDGMTLTAMLAKKTLLELRTARDIATQFLAGLEAIHQAGLVHRDLKPENIMITRTGRVVVMDFGIAKQVTQVEGTISGTPPYMSPEQRAGEKVDARSDIYSAGVILAEMIHPGGVFSQKTREGIWSMVRKDPLQLPDTPWKTVIACAVAQDPSQRFSSAAALSRALEEVAQRVETIEERKPYPGLASFSAADAAYFFGRELEVETVIKKLQQLHLMALIGPSGAGKTSFLRAGLIPVLPPNWDYIFCTPGDSPAINLGQALVPKISGDVELIQKLLRFDDTQIAISILDRWRKNHPEVLLIIDRFEELFTLNSSTVQSQYADLIGKAALEANVRVLLVMRDDFLMFCHGHPPLVPIFSELTGLSPLSGTALRRALVQPALKCGYRFEDEELVDEIIADVEKERGALPLMAFAAACLWEKRERTSGLLTRQSYKEIGGVAGALAQHAESTMDRIGIEGQPIVREIFRNLITAQNTRAARDIDELLSVFTAKSAAEEVLRTLIDARLLTSFEAPQSEQENPRSRVEIIHESLISNWPRLVRWQTQDEESAQLRDQLRQSSQMWQQRNRSQDLLWTGAAYLEFQAWRQTYSGGLTPTEEAFAHAMTARATKSRRQRRAVISAIIVVLLIVVAVFANSWREEKQSRESAEASKVLALGRNELQKDPTVAVAYAIASLQIADTANGRQFALEALSKAPPASIEPNLPIRPTFLQFSPDGNWLAAGGAMGLRLLRRDGKKTIILEDGLSKTWRCRAPQFSANGDFLVWVSPYDPTMVRIWSIKTQKEIKHFQMEGKTVNFIRGNRLFLITDTVGRNSAYTDVFVRLDLSGWDSGWTNARIRSWDFKDIEPKIIGNLDLQNMSGYDIDPSGKWLVYNTGNSVYLRSIENLSATPRLIGQHKNASRVVTFNPSGTQVASSDSNGEIRLWSLDNSSETPLRIINGKEPVYGMYFSHSGSILAVSYKHEGIKLWDLNAPIENEPLTLQRNLEPSFPFVTFSPDDKWVAAAYIDSIAIWPLNQKLPLVLHGDGEEGAWGVHFTPDGKSLIAGFSIGSIYLWPWMTDTTRILWKPPAGEINSIDVDPKARFLGIGTSHEGAFLISLADGTATPIPGTLSERALHRISFSPDGKLAAIGTDKDDRGIRIWNLQSRDVSILNGSEGMRIILLEFASDESLFSSDDQGRLRRWDLKNSTSRVVLTAKGAGMKIGSITFAKNNHDLLACVLGLYVYEDYTQFRSEVRMINLKDGSSRTISSHGNRVYVAKFDVSGNSLITGDMDGIVRVGPISGEEPHLFFGHTSGIVALDVHPHNNWIASTEMMKPIVRVWPVPTGRPLQLLSHDELLTRLRSLTNVRIVADSATASGYQTKFEALKGWEESPTW